MVFGEPDVEIRRVEPQIAPIDAEKKNLRKSAQPAFQYILEIKGLDVYDPTTGAIRNSSTDDIACWFIDTDYNGESFFVRHAYFTGADEPYDKLKRALRADIDEAAWSSLYSTVSRPFNRPASGKIAVKVINHYGDEVLKVFAV
jgi:adenine-specific DNA-methyltransferase